MKLQHPPFSRFMQEEADKKKRSKWLKKVSFGKYKRNGMEYVESMSGMTTECMTAHLNIGVSL